MIDQITERYLHAKKEIAQLYVSNPKDELVEDDMQLLDNKYKDMLTEIGEFKKFIKELEDHRNFSQPLNQQSQ